MNPVISIRKSFCLFPFLFSSFFLAGSETQSPQNRSDSLLAISYHKRIVRHDGMNTQEFWEKNNKVTYISAGAIVNIERTDGLRIPEVGIQKIFRDSLFWEDQSISISEIESIRVIDNSRKRLRTFLGIFVLLIGILAAIYWIAFFFFFAGGEDILEQPLAFLVGTSIPVAILLGGFKLLPLFPRFKLKGPRFSWKIVGKPDFSSKKEKKLGKKGFVKVRNR